MSLSQTKRIGVYLPFKNFKTKEEAVKRLINDCKKFGVKFSSYFEEQELIQGYGESVCFLVDDLLNRELIRRDYKFEHPIIPEDSESDSDEIEEAKEEDRAIVFESNTETKHSPNSPTRRTKIIVKNSSVAENGKVTKTNFFTADSNRKIQSDEELLDLNESMISCKVDPEQWYEEVERVKEQLVTFQKSQIGVDLGPLEEFMEHIDKLVKYIKQAKTIISEEYGFKKTLNKLVDVLSGDLYYISKEEARITRNNESQIKKLDRVAIK